MVKENIKNGKVFLFPSIISTHEDYFFQKKKNGDRINLLSRFQ